MKKLRYIFLSILVCISIIDTKLITPRSRSVISTELYHTITPTNLVHGITIDRSGSYALSSSTTIPTGAASAQETTTIAGDAVSYNAGVISITASNVLLNLNGMSLKTNKTSLVAIQIADGLSNITIENGTILSGTQSWSSAIVAGYNCQDITLRDITAIGCSAADGAIYLKGSGGNSNVNAILENITVLDYVYSSTANICAIRIDNYNSVFCKNIKSNNANITTTGWFCGMKLDTCSNITAIDIQTNNNTCDANNGSDGFEVNDATNIYLENISSLNNTDSSTSGGDNRGVSLYNSFNIEIFNLKTMNLTSTGNGSTDGILLNNVDNAKLTNITASNNSASDNWISGIEIDGCSHLQCTNIDISNNVSPDEAAGLWIDGCNNSTFTNVTVSSVDGTTTKDGIGISILDSESLSFDDCSINNLLNAQAGILFYDSSASNISFNSCSISNCDSGTTSDFVAINSVDGGTRIHGLNITNCSITNNTAATTFRGINMVNLESKNFLLDNININNNSSADGDLYGINLTSLSGVTLSHCKVETNSSTNAATKNLYGLSVSSTVSNLKISNCSFSNNSTTSDATTGKTIAGVSITGVNGLTIENCTSNNNQGAGKAYGFYLASLDRAQLTSCTANQNKAATITTGTTDAKGIEALPTAGFYLSQCNFCTVENCVAKSNLAGNWSRSGDGTPTTQATDVINLTNSCSGFGFLNIGTSNSVPSNGNIFASCQAHGNGTQLDTGTQTTTLGGAYPSLGVGLPTRYWLSENVAGGFGDQWSLGTEYKNCTANSNGLQDNLISYGFLITNSANNKSVSVNVDRCSASNNWFFGFCDDGAQQGTRINSETTFTGCYAAMNGQQNSSAISQAFVPVGGVASDADGHIRNYYMHFTDNGQYTPIKLISYGNQDFSQIPGNRFFNLSLTYEA